MTKQELDQLAINTIRTLSIDAVQQAKSGHPGTPMALAPLVYTLWNRVMRFDPKDPIWPNRDRFVLSNGHASMLLWSVLYLTQTQAVNAEYESLGQPSVTLDDIRHFRRIDSKAPGHPEYHLVSGVETTTGPLGQGVRVEHGLHLGGAVRRGHDDDQGDRAGRRHRVHRVDEHRRPVQRAERLIERRLVNNGAIEEFNCVTYRCLDHSGQRYELMNQM